MIQPSENPVEIGVFLSTGVYSSEHPSTPIISFPNNGEIVTGKFTIEWDLSFDPFGHEISYSLFYSDDYGSSWILLTENLNRTSYVWDTTNITDGVTFLVKVIAFCTNSSNSDISDTSYSIDNSAPKVFLHNLLNSSILTPENIVRFNISDSSLDEVRFHWNDLTNQTLFVPYTI